ncbi:DUF2931 family protein [Erwinia amylovora]|uniref:Putative lipoprotein n=11 Tax=Erwinia amylovora TaxID=552 RepID=A0A830ZYU4_ERWAM|nr:DUF2931 family protein [Erwinia amylovora]EKV54596.1 putative lipoprotein [Erwinia amylovora ACW56400]UDJ88410.1 DUF2931 family protein [Erwinia amylovora]UDJ99869.1 DUF2931 family protein [Erwinia amylovora]UDK88075.1 DUF2931 family protein [Erwinia amylovora]UDK91469.1 DUF2931 family protein [Erwinia amylovora]
MLKPKALYSLALLLLLNGCQTGKPRTPQETGEMPYGKWRFAFFTPHALPAVVTRAMIIDSEKVVSSYRTLDGTPGDPDTIQKWRDRTRIPAHFNKARHPPVLMLFCWDSIIDKKTYETQIIFPPSLRKIMLTPTGKDRQGNTAWYKTLLFGLAPEGKVRIWLQNSAAGDNVALEPKKITTLSGDQLDACKGITRHSQGYGYTQTTQDFIKGKTYPYGEW